MRRFRHFHAVSRAILSLSLLLVGLFSFFPAFSDEPVSAPSRTRVVPYSPTLAAMAFEMGFGDRVVGITRWTRLPDGEKRPVVGDALSVDVEALLAVRPDVIAVQGERISGLAVLSRVAPAIRVETIRIERLADISVAAHRLAALAGIPDRADAAVTAFERTLAAVRKALPPESRPRVLFVLGTTRPTVAGPDTFVADLLRLCGGINAGDDIQGRTFWRPTDLESIARAAPDVLICQIGEGEAVEPARAWWMARTLIPAARNGRVYIVDDPGWTIPSLSIASFIPRLRQMIVAPSGAEEGRK